MLLSAKARANMIAAAIYSTQCEQPPQMCGHFSNNEKFPMEIHWRSDHLPNTATATLSMSSSHHEDFHLSSNQSQKIEFILDFGTMYSIFLS